MKVVPPITIGDAQLVGSSAVEPAAGEVAWNSATAYAEKDRAYLPANHTVYERLIAGTTSTSPDQDPTNWTPVGQTNRWQMFDLLRNTGTTAASPLVVTIAPGQHVSSIALVGLDAETAEIDMTFGGSTVYSVTDDLNNREVVTWSDYFFEPFSTKADTAHFDLPPYAGGQITVTLTKTSGPVTCGGLLVGTYVDLGETEMNGVSDVLNFSVINRDDFGNSQLIPRRNIPKVNVTAHPDRSAVNKIRDVRTLLNAAPAFWSWLDDADDDYFDAGTILGIYRTFTITMDGPDGPTVALELEEV